MGHSGARRGQGELSAGLGCSAEMLGQGPPCLGVHITLHPLGNACWGHACKWLSFSELLCTKEGGPWGFPSFGTLCKVQSLRHMLGPGLRIHGSGGGWGPEGPQGAAG